MVMRRAHSGTSQSGHQVRGVRNGASLGGASLLDLPHLSNAGVLEICAKTRCSSGRPVVETWGFQPVRHAYAGHFSY